MPPFPRGMSWAFKRGTCSTPESDVQDALGTMFAGTEVAYNREAFGNEEACRENLQGNPDVDFSIRGPASCRMRGGSE
jgi:hypothetical protein